MKSILLLILIFNFKVLYSQSINFDWSRRWINATQGTDVETDDNGNIYLISYGNSNTNFNLNAGNILGPTFGCAAVTKLDPNGSTIWIKFIESTGASSGGIMPSNICVKNGFIYVSGVFGGGGGTFDFDPGIGAASSSGLNPTLKGFIFKWDINGNYVWHKTISTSQAVSINDLFIDSNENIYLCGSFNQTLYSSTFSLTSNGGGDCFFMKLDTSGNTILMKSFGSVDASPDEINGICVNSSGEIYVTGSFFQSVDFDPGAGLSIFSSNGASDVFVSKFDSQGIFIWTHTFGSSNFQDKGSDIILDENENIVFTGTTMGSVDFDPSNVVFNLNNTINYAYVVKWNSIGNFIWAKGIYSDQNAQGLQLSFINSNIGLAGICSGNTDFDPSNIVNNLNSSGGLWNTFILKLNSFGQYLWAGVLSNVDGNMNKPTGLVETSNAILVCGEFKGSMNSNPILNQSNILNSLTNTSGVPNFSNFLVKLSQCLTTTSYQTISSCSSYYWPVNNQTYNTTGVYTVTLPNFNGCDSIVTLNLTINAPTTNSTAVSSCNSYNWNGNIYNTSGVYNQVLSTSNGCDSTVTLNLTITNSPSAIVTSLDGITLNANVVPNATYQWIYCSDLTPITNQTLSQFIPQINGLYAVVITNNCGSDTSECATVNTIGFNELQWNNVQIFPNPSNGIFTLKLNSSINPPLFFVTDLQGRILLTEQLTDSEMKVDLSKFSNGTYFIHLDGIGVFQLIKQ